MSKLNKTLALLTLSAALSVNAMASSENEGEAIGRQTAAITTNVPAAETVTEAPKPKYWVGKAFAALFGNKAATAIGRGIGIDYSKTYVEVDQTQKTVVDAFSGLTAEEQAQILQAIKARDLQSVLKPNTNAKQNDEGAEQVVAPVAPNAPPAPAAPEAPAIVPVKAAANGALLGQIQKGISLKKTETVVRQPSPIADEGNLANSLAAAVTGRRGALEHSDNEESDEWSE